jgi:hypothetical protein
LSLLNIKIPIKNIGRQRCAEGFNSGVKGLICQPGLRFAPMYQYNDRLTQLFTKYKYIWYLATMFRPFTGSSSGLYNKPESGLLYKPDIAKY